MSRLKETISAYVRTDQKEDLDALAIISRVPTAVRVREAIDLVLQHAREDGLLPEREVSNG